jgi:hypothetical protein
MKKLVLQKILLQQIELRAFFCLRNGIPRACFYFCFRERIPKLFSLPWNGSQRNSMCLLLFLFHGTKFKIVVSSTEWFGMESRDYAYFCSRVQNSEHFSPLRNGLERNSESTLFFVPWYRIPSIFLLCGMEFREYTFLFHSTKNAEHFSPLRKCSEQSSESMLILVPRYRIPMLQNRIPRVCLLFHDTEFRDFFSCAEWLGTEFPTCGSPALGRTVS